MRRDIEDGVDGYLIPVFSYVRPIEAGNEGFVDETARPRSCLLLLRVRYEAAVAPPRMIAPPPMSSR